MNRLAFRFLAATILFTATSCAREEEYHLTEEQLAWQGYRIGQELSFGHAQDGQVRTYRVTDVQDHMESQYTGYTVSLFAAPDIDCQQVTITVQRTDSAFRPQTALKLGLYYDESDETVKLEAQTDWEAAYSVYLPIDSVSQGAPIDTLNYYYRSAKLLASATFGPLTYAQVIHVKPYQYGSRAIRNLYYAKGKGVVAFEENGSGLWFRLP